MAIGGDPMLESFAASLRAETERALEERGQDTQFPGVEALRRAGASSTMNQPVSSSLPSSSALQVEVPPLLSSDPVLAQFCSELRQSTERALQGSQAKVSSPILPRRTRSRWASVAGIAACAAMAVLLVNLPEVVQFGQTVQSQVASLAPWNKNKVLEQSGVARDRRRRSAGSVQHAPEMTVAKKSVVVPDSLPLLDEALSGSTSTSVSTLAKAQVAQAGPDLAPKKLSDAVLMRQAHRLWKQGKTKRAQRLLRRVAYRSSDRDAAQAAFADLFSIGRQLGGRSVLVKEWNRYLKSFPKGRYAQDAWAGRCLAFEGGDRARACWREYVQRFPRGVYARKAKKSLDGDPR